MKLHKMRAFLERKFLYLGFQVALIVLIASVVVVTSKTLALGQTASQKQPCIQCQKWQSFSSKTIMIPSAESDYFQGDKTYPKFISWLLKGPLLWRPEISGDMKSKCPLALREMRQANLRRLSDDDVNLMFADCQKSDLWSSYLGFVRMLSVDFHHEQHPFFHPVVINLPEGQKIKGLLGLHSFTQKRPLVILRLGVFGNALEFLGEKYLPIQFLEQGPFNVLIVESTSGSDYMNMNKTRWGLAGIDEGLQNYFIAKALSSSGEPLSQLVSSIHFVGMSLGGQGIFTVSEILKQQPLAKVKGLVAMCPVVHLEESLRGLVAKPGQGFLTDLWMQQRLENYIKAKFGEKYHGRSAKGVLTLQPEVTNELIRLLDNNREIPNFREWGVQVSALSARQSLDMSAERLKISDIPFTIISARDDAIVNFAKNTKRLKTLEGRHKNFKIFALEKGHHCAFPVTYDWSITAELMKKITLSSVELNWRYHETALVMAAPDINTRIEIAAVAYDNEAQRWKVTLSNSPGGDDIVIQLDRSDLDFDFPNDDLSEQEKVVGIRWLWQNLEVQRDDVRGTWKLRWPVYKFN